MNYSMKSDAFKSRYKNVNTPGKFKLTVRSVSNLMPNPNLPGTNMRIVNFYGLFPQHITKDLINQIRSGNVDVTNLRTISYQVGENAQVPGKGEQVDVTIGSYTNKNAEEVLIVTAMTIPVATQLSANSWDSIVTPEENHEDVLTPAGVEAEVDVF